MTRFLLTSALLALSGAAIAQAPPAAGSRVQADARADARVDRYCIRETGSRIPVARRADSGKEQRACTVAGRGRVYTRQDIEASGRVDLADALRALDPSIR